MNAVSTNTHTFNAVQGRQAGRNFYTAICTMKSVVKIFTFNGADIPAEHRAQRTLRKSRIPRIRDYMLENTKDYIFSSITVSVNGKITFNPLSRGENADIGTISISQDASVLINDGQHRMAAIKEAIQDNVELGTDEISVVFFEDISLKKSQQMFADLNRHAVKPTKSLDILYDNRNDFSAFIVEMIKHIKIFRNRTEIEKTSISNRSTKFFTLNGVAKATEHLLGKDKTLTDVKKRLIIDFWNEVSDNVPEWSLLIEERTSPAELRSDYVHGNTNMLESIAKAGRVLIERFPHGGWKEKLKGFGNVDWGRTNPEWEGSVIRDGKMQKTIRGMNKASEILLKHCDVRM